MSEPSSSDIKKTVPGKKPISPARNIIGIIILLGVVVIGGFEVYTKHGYNAAVTALNARTQEENQDLLTVQEAESLLGKGTGRPCHRIQRGSLALQQANIHLAGIVQALHIGGLLHEGEGFPSSSL